MFVFLRTVRQRSKKTANAEVLRESYWRHIPTMTTSGSCAFSLFCIQTGAFKLLWSPKLLHLPWSSTTPPLDEKLDPHPVRCWYHYPCQTMVPLPPVDCWYRPVSDVGIPHPLWDAGDPTPTVGWNMGMDLHVVLCACVQGHLRPAPQGPPSYLYWLEFHFGEVGFLRHKPQFYHLRFAELNLIRSVLQNNILFVKRVWKELTKARQIKP